MGEVSNTPVRGGRRGHSRIAFVRHRHPHQSHRGLGSLAGILMSLYISSMRLFQAPFVRILGEGVNLCHTFEHPGALARAFMPVRLKLQALADKYFKE